MGRGSGYEEMRRLVDAIRDGNVLTLRRQVESHGAQAVRDMQADDVSEHPAVIACFEDMLAVGSGLLCCGQGRDLVYMSAYSGSLPCLDYLLGALGEHECINRAYKVPSPSPPCPW